MSTAAAQSRPTPPGEEDLQALYNQVLAGFVDESPTAERSPTTILSSSQQGERDLEALYSAYGGEANVDLGRSFSTTAQPPSRTPSASVAQKPSPSPSPSPRLPTNPRDVGRPLPSLQSGHSGRGMRPLPRPPGSSASISSIGPPMPEPRPYYSPESSAGGGKSAASEPGNGQTSTARPSSADSRHTGLPSNPRPSNSAHSSANAVPVRPESATSSFDLAYEPSSARTSAHSQYSYHMPIPEISTNDVDRQGGGATWNGRNGGAGGMGRKTSVRPSGALAPQIPGHPGYIVPEDGSEVNGGSPGPVPPPPPPLDAYAQYLKPGSSLQKAPSRSSSRTALNNNGRVSSEDLRTPQSGFPAHTQGTPSYTNGSSSQLDRSVSAGSVVSYDSLNRAISMTSTSSSTPFSDFDRVLFSSPTSTVPTSLDRGDSTSSYNSSYFPSGAEHTIRHDASYQAHPDGDARTPTTPSQPEPGPSHQHQHRHQNEYTRQLETFKPKLELHEDVVDDYDDDLYFDGESEDSEPEDRFVNFALVSHLAVRLRDRVPRGTHVKGGIPYPRAFTGKDIVSTIQSQIQRELLINHGISTNDRRAALQVARSLQSQLFFYEVEWGGRVLQDGVEDVYMFLDDQEGGSEARPEMEELPTGVITMLTKCYSPSCTEEDPCYAYACPRRQKPLLDELPLPEPPKDTQKAEEWSQTIPPEILRSLPESEISRQTIIHKVISKEEQYCEDLDIVESLFIKPLRNASPPIIDPARLDEVIDEIFGNILDLRECNRRLLENLYVRQREQAPIIQRIGDVFLGAAAEFRLAYPIYMGHLPLAEKKMRDEMENNLEFRMFIEQAARHPDSRRLDWKHFLNRPSEHLQKYPVLLEAIQHETAEGNADADFLKEATQAIKNLQSVAQLRTFQSAMCKGPTAKLEWHNLVSEEFRLSLPKKEPKRQSILFEVIKGEMSYVRDLENFEFIFIKPLRSADPPIIPPERLDSFISDVFHNYKELVAHHRKLLEALHEIQREEHPLIRSLTAAVLDAFLNFRDAYLEYVPHYPIASYRIDDELANNPAFKTFVEECVRNPDAHKLDMKSFIMRPIPRLLRYDLLFTSILDETPPGHDDRQAVPQLLEVIKALGKETEPGVTSAKQKVELWRYNANLVFKPGEAIDMDLLNENRSLIHTGKVLRQPDTGFEWSGWSELFILLFDNYMVMTKPREKDGVTKYHVNRRPIPLDLLTLVNFNDPPTPRSTGLLRGLRGGEKHGDTPGVTSPGVANSPETSSDARAVYPWSVHHNGRMGGLNILYAETAPSRLEWKQKLEEAIGLRKVVQESNKVFEVETLSADTFLIPSIGAGTTSPSWSHENSLTGKVTCSVPFNTADGRPLVAIGCAEGVWIGFRHDSKSMRRVLHLKMVTQCAILEEFGIFLVLADKSLFAYHIEALVPSSPQSAHTSQTPQKLSGNRDVQFFSVGNLAGRILVIYMKKKGLESIFRVLEPVVANINDRTRAPMSLGSRFGLRPGKSEWFRVYRDFFLPSESFDLIFLKAKIAILCTRGFEIMDLIDLKSTTVPQRDDARLEKLAKRCESCKPVGMFRSSEDEFLLCYDEFGLYVDRHGDLSRAINTIEWEGTAERVAWHPPYVLLFDTRFIEVRHVETGRLVQIIPGNDLRCIWDGRGSHGNTSTPGPDGWQENGVNQDAKVHGVMNVAEPVTLPGTGNKTIRAVAQHVFELVPTVPLYLPEPLTSPSQPAYFPQSNSPPHSPNLNPQWR